jgi:hypothetical protein
MKPCVVVAAAVMTLAADGTVRAALEPRDRFSTEVR